MKNLKSSFYKLFIADQCYHTEAGRDDHQNQAKLNFHFVLCGKELKINTQGQIQKEYTVLQETTFVQFNTDRYNLKKRDKYHLFLFYKQQVSAYSMTVLS